MPSPEFPTERKTHHATNEWLARMETAQRQIRDALPWVTTGVAAAHAGSHLASEVLRLVHGMHGNISAAPPVFAQQQESPTRGITKLVYDCIETGFTGTERALSTLASALPDNTHEHPQWLNIQAAVNGVIGDRLAATGNRLSIPMQRVALDRQNKNPHVVLFLHGLCMSELGWNSKAHDDLCTSLQNKHMRVEYLRYNSGRHISENGAELAVTLAELVATEDPCSISLVGHSMGGLVIRSAIAQAATVAASDEWVNRLKSSVFLGSPHHGAPLERLGNHANRILKVSPYTAPLMRLGNIRSAGIQDLRHGCIVEDDWSTREDHDDILDYRTQQALPDHVEHLLVAATRSATVPDALHTALDDYLVPVRSALGICPQNRLTLDARRLTRHTLPGSHHMDLLSSVETNRMLHDHLQR